MAKPKLALIPATQGSKLYSVLPADGVGDFTFSRNSAATRINKDGLIETVAVGKSRLNYPLIDGVVNGCPSHLLEPSRLQKIQYSEAFNETYWNKADVTFLGGQLSPSGDTSAFKVVANATTSRHRLVSSPITTTNAEQTVSAYYKKGEVEYGVLGVSTANVTNTYSTIYNLTDGTKLTSFSYGTSPFISEKIESIGDYWRISITFQGSINVYISIGTSNATPTNVAGFPSYQGNGTSGIYIYGAQLEQGSFPTSYIPNYGTSAGITRVAETANGAGDASTFNDSEGVLMAEISALADDGTTKVLSISDGGNSTNVVRIGYSTTSNLINVRLMVNSVTTTFNYVGNTLNQNKIALKWKLNNTALWVNGLEVDTELSFNTFSLNTLNVLNLSNGNGTSNPFYGNTKQLQYFDSALNDSDLETLTSWASFTEMANGQTYSIK